MNNSSLNRAQTWAMVRAWWYCWWRFPFNGAMRCITYDADTHELAYISAKGLDGELLKIFWTKWDA